MGTNPFIHVPTSSCSISVALVLKWNMVKAHTNDQVVLLSHCSTILGILVTFFKDCYCWTLNLQEGPSQDYHGTLRLLLLNCWRGNSFPSWPALFQNASKRSWEEKREIRQWTEEESVLNEVVHNSYVLVSLLRTNRLLSKSSHAHTFIYLLFFLLHRNR